MSGVMNDVVSLGTKSGILRSILYGWICKSDSTCNVFLYLFLA